MFLLSLLITSLISPAFAKSNPLYYSPTSQEGTFTYEASVDLESETPPTDDEARAQIGEQYFYMLGNLRWGVEGMSATPSKSYELSNISSTDLGGGIYRISYSAKTNIVLEKTQKPGPLKFSVPRAPEYVTSLDQSCTNDKSGEPNWYGFNPHLQGCPLVADKDFIVVTGQVEIKPNTLLSFPQYEDLVKKDNTLHMSILMNQEIVSDKGINEKLVNAGFTQKTWTAEELQQFLGFIPDPSTRVNEFNRTTGAHPMRVLVFMGNANVDSRRAKAFHYFYKNALEQDDVVVYSGHSGLSRNVDLALIEQRENFKITVRPDYQLYFLAGCITYGYYVDGYLARKASPEDTCGTKNLDVITFGTASPGWDDKPLFALTDALLGFTKDGARASYQSLTDKITYSWFGIVGDEDNSPSLN